MVRKERQPDIPDAQLAVLNVIWEEGALSARAITERLYPTCTESDVGTVHSLLQRLETKGLIRRDQSQRPILFRPALSRSEVAGQQLEAMAQKLGGGSITPLIAHLVDAGKLSDAEIEEILILLKQHTPKKQRRR